MQSKVLFAYILNCIVLCSEEEPTEVQKVFRKSEMNVFAINNLINSQ